MNDRATATAVARIEPPAAAPRRFAITVTVDYADTDAGGVVYYANYLTCMERARNAWLRALGFPLNELARRHRVLFTVVEAHLHYHAPARLDDELLAILRIMKLQRASIRFCQTVQRGGDDGDDGGALLVDAEIRLGAVNSDTFKPCKLPAELTNAIDRWQRGESTNTVDAAVDAAVDARATVAKPQPAQPPAEPFHAD